MPSVVFEDYKVIDVDTHVSEPEDLWTSRVSVKKWGDMVPHVFSYEEVMERGAGSSTYKPGERVWIFGGEPAAGVARVALTHHDKPYPSHPLTLEEATPGAHLPEPRLAYMDEEGIYAQIIYPNVAGFGSARFLQLKEPELMIACVRAYNDFLVEWCSSDADRLIPLAALPFWDGGPVRRRDGARGEEGSPRHRLGRAHGDLRAAAPGGPALGAGLATGRGPRTRRQLPHRRQPRPDLLEGLRGDPGNSADTAHPKYHAGQHGAHHGHDPVRCHPSPPQAEHRGGRKAVSAGSRSCST